MALSIMEGKSDTEYVAAEYGRGYSEDVDVLRDREYPLLKDTVYLDHAGTTIYPKTLIDSFSRELTSNLFGNPHSLSASSQLSTQRVDDVRLRALRFFNADPDEFDLVFVANATAAIKLVAGALQDLDHGFWYGYHVDAHTSLVGARELAKRGNRCFLSDREVDQWISEITTAQTATTRLFAYPAQSNMNGRRLPRQWCEKIRRAGHGGENVYTLLDAASLVSSSPLDLSDVETAPDFTALSFYKIFGFPDLGALIVRKKSAHVLRQRKFFGGGTVDMVLALEMQWHAKKESIHDYLEDGTLPFHNIIALDCAFDIHSRLYGSMTNVSSHTQFVTQRLYERLASLTHANGNKLCHIYTDPASEYAESSTQGPIIAFNMRNSQGGWIGKADVERLATVKNIQLRTGTLCNPAGTASSLGWTSAELRHNFSLGLRCGDDHDVMSGRPTGIVRLSVGAMTNMKDIDTLVAFLEEFYIEKTTPINALSLTPIVVNDPAPEPKFYIESLSVYPIKSCGAFKVPSGTRWEIKREGLAWDREWCLIHQGTGAALNQKRYPRMALIRPFVDLDNGILRVTCGTTSTDEKSIEIPLSRQDSSVVSTSLCPNSSNKSSTVCGDQVILQAYTSPMVSAFFSAFLGVPCTLARFPSQSIRQSTLGLPAPRKPAPKSFTMPGSFPEDCPQPPVQAPILLSNESPILLISRSSVNRLNETIKATSKRSNGAGKAVAADVFRGNIVVAERLSQPGQLEHPYLEDHWTTLSIGSDYVQLGVLGPCNRCQMVCIDQWTGVRRDEPFSTLAKTRKVDGKVPFGRHASLAAFPGEEGLEGRSVMIGDPVVPSYDHV